MEPIVNEKYQNVIEKLKTKKHILIIAGLFALSLILSLTYVSMVFSSSNIYPNIKVLNVDIGGLSKEKAQEKLTTFFAGKENEKLSIDVSGKQEATTYKELDVKYDVTGAVEKAFNLGRSGGFAKRINDIMGLDIKGSVVDISFSYNQDKVKEIVSNLNKGILIKPIDDSYQIKGGQLIFSYGKEGSGINEKEALLSIEKKLKEAQSGQINLSVTTLSHNKLNADSIPTEPKDATYTVENNKTIKYIPEVYGIVFDKEEFTELLENNSLSKKSFSVDIGVTKPKVFIEDIRKMIFIHTLGSHDTYYGSSPANRKTNVSLAASRIDNIILAPGDTFSYNKVVGPRTPEKGFKLAHVYSNGKIIDDYGGGICQVSTTLYNAAIKADLGIVERRNHMFTVAYAPPGMDATVSYGIDDFKFTNNTKWPIKIINKTTSTNVGFVIMGTNLTPEKTVEFRRQVLKEIPFTIKEILDPNLDAGKVVVAQNGTNGFVVNVYKITKINGVFQKEEFLHKDTYRALEKIVRKGTKGASPTGTEGTTPSAETPVVDPQTPIDQQETKPDTATTNEQTAPVIDQQETPAVGQ